MLRLPILLFCVFALAPGAALAVDDDRIAHDGNTPAAAGATGDDPLGQLAAPSFCAGEQALVGKPIEAEGAEREDGPRGGADGASAGAAADPVAGMPRTRFDPISVAAGPPGGSALPVPDPTRSTRPGPCDDPGSGCLGPVAPPIRVAPTPSVTPRPRRRPAPAAAVDPNPNTGCGAPGFCTE